MIVTLYTRAGCHLCEIALGVIERVAAGRAEVELVDIDSDPRLLERYTVRVPVVAVDGREIAEYEIDAAQLDAALAGASDSPSGPTSTPQRSTTAPDGHR
ncbi:MAG: glutaredoxin family protein [Actinomycetota bacterium]|nr:glutaredoxin family protein [Euzebyaceae bacterium]MDQ3452493.1 glutaredoxin family protein [Actinomycetota bacterium]